MLISVKECPVCGGNLDEVYLTANRNFYLSAAKAKLGVYFLDTVMPSVSSVALLENAPALKCENCGIAIIDYIKRPDTHQRAFSRIVSDACMPWKRSEYSSERC